jgi:hypothetical protein
MNARDFYYKFIAPGEEGKSYTATYSVDTLNSQEFLAELNRLFESGFITEEEYESIERIKNKIPHLSNDFVIEELLGKILSHVHPKIKQRLETAFVAKRKEYSPNAFALSSSEDFTGDLILFHVGLSNACSQFITLYSERKALQEIGFELGKDHPEVKERISFFTIQVDKLKESQRLWNVLDGMILFPFSLSLESSSRQTFVEAVEYRQYTDLFILGHEISHHLLGHTGKGSEGQRFLQKIPVEYQLWRQASPNHAKELQADALSLLLITGMTSDELIEEKGPLFYKAVMGSLLSMIVLGKVSGGVDIETSTHPSASTRIKQCHNVLSLFLPSDILGGLENYVFSFQEFLRNW